MKFLDRLDAEAVLDWRPKYLDYRRLKRLLREIYCIKSRTKQDESNDEIYKSSQIIEIETESEIHSEAEIIFFKAVDGELQKIINFYREQEAEEADRKREILRYLDSKKLDVHGDDAETIYTNYDDDESERSSFMSAYEQANPIPSTPKNEETGNGDNVDYFQFSNLSLTKNRRNRLKRSLRDLYRKLENLKSYRTLNYTGFFKILGEFDKISGTKKGREYFERKVKSVGIWTSKTLDRLFLDVENVYSRIFTGGDSHDAVHELTSGASKTQGYYPAAVKGGIYWGISIALIGRVLVHYASNETISPRLWNLFYIYAGQFLPFLVLLLFSVTVLAWEKCFINYRFIFEFDIHSALHKCQFFELSGLLALLFVLVAYSILFNTFSFGKDALIFMPWLPFMTVACLFFVPARLLYWRSRFWLIRVFGRIFSAPLFPLKFKDFFVNNQILSSILAVQCVAWSALASFDPSRLDHQTYALPSHFIIPLAAFIPFLIRTIQCCRRFYDSGFVISNLFNAFRYGIRTFAFLFQVIIYALRIPINPYMLIFDLLIFVNTIYSIGWEMIMDFGFWTLDKTRHYMRDNLPFQDENIYYMGMALNIVARFFWIFPMLKHLVAWKYLPKSFFTAIPLLQLSDMSLALLIGVVEICRRAQWNFYRVVYEHLNNSNSFNQTNLTLDLFYHDMVKLTNEQAREDQVNQLNEETTEEDEEEAESVDSDDPKLS